jgi:hypothetical protein
MSVYLTKRKGEVSKFYVCEFVYQGKRFQESKGATIKTVAKEYEKSRKKELERRPDCPQSRKQSASEPWKMLLAPIWKATS